MSNSAILILEPKTVVSCKSMRHVVGIKKRDVRGLRKAVAA